MKKLKVLTTVGTRPEIIRLSRVLSRLDNYCDHVLVHTGQNYDFELNKIFFNDLGIREPNFYLNITQNVSGPSQAIGNLLIEIDKVLEEVEPDAMLVLGDTNSALSVIAAKKRKIPIFHMEAGNRCFDQRVPEEINRRIVDHTADVNLTYSTIAREYLLREGIQPDLVIKTGSPMREVLMHYLPKIQMSNVLERLNLKKNGYFLVSTHREENIESQKCFSKLVVLLNMLAEDYGIPVIVSTHPRTKNKVDKTGTIFHPNVQLIKPLSFSDYNKLQIHARVVLSDSGTISEESSILDFPALNLRQAHERPEAMEEAVVMMVGLEADRVNQGLTILNNQPRRDQGDDSEVIKIVSDYDSMNVSAKVLRIIHSYTDYVNRVIWKKY
ncbi:non-hydrolyzing UDP-N-acetylglucosamine 2-epimerase [Polynucleobacter sp. AP-Feld-500C-C5]|uniref:non-hydrolyzing UDP-N-acetylglucosamine 2-epimerase n=1 Tax=Polynucleobacter sp. AP-Feld-500C-C5 TaxID=2576924 RepID=UPI001C0B2315|nr:UDP-N-acetylglucosamine 2-epimerase (non-hydrolyzing) [Polynucleobacter sp. AP-Feld-500C-C5]MBU3632903.1 UDP-N-acetylglucosamine 2-epimerase (non-hydrolyzing) [Polynucleobacter sp. AP-Feld-500C-C5]